MLLRLQKISRFKIDELLIFERRILNLVTAAAYYCHCCFNTQFMSSDVSDVSDLDTTTKDQTKFDIYIVMSLTNRYP